MNNMGILCNHINQTMEVAAREFIAEIDKGLQNIKLSRVGAHHQNGIMECPIQTILGQRTYFTHAYGHLLTDNSQHKPLANDN